MKKLLLVLLCLPFLGFGQNIYLLEETKMNTDSTMRVLISNNQPVNGVIKGHSEKWIVNHEYVCKNWKFRIPLSVE